MIPRITVLAAATTATIAAGAALAPAATTGPRVVRLDGIGPLKLGMTRADAVRTGWLTGRGTGCELGGTPLPITYRLAGPRAPRGITGVAEFRGGRLRDLSFTKGVYTARGVTVGRTTVARMVRRYTGDGYKARARYDATFQGTFVTVTRNGRRVLGAFASGTVVETLGLPGVPVCE